MLYLRPRHRPLVGAIRREVTKRHRRGVGSLPRPRLRAFFCPPAERTLWISLSAKTLSMWFVAWSILYVVLLRNVTSPLAASTNKSAPFETLFVYRVALDALGLKRYCCRRMILTHADLIDKLLAYNSEAPCLFARVPISLLQPVLAACTSLKWSHCCHILFVVLQSTKRKSQISRSQYAIVLAGGGRLATPEHTEACAGLPLTT